MTLHKLLHPSSVLLHAQVQLCALGFKRALQRIPHLADMDDMVDEANIRVVHDPLPDWTWHVCRGSRAKAVGKPKWNTLRRRKDGAYAYTTRRRMT